MTLTPTPIPSPIPWETLTPFPTALPGDAPIQVPLVSSSNMATMLESAVQSYNLIPFNARDLVLGVILFVVVLVFVWMILEKMGDD
jgi:hypothetical protein